MNVLQLFADSFQTEKLIITNFLQTKCDITPKTAVLRFWAPSPLGA